MPDIETTQGTHIAAPATERLVSLDVFRGLTIGAMVLVNNPGDWTAIHPPLEHAEWHGWTFTDTIFPFFLLIVGIAIPMAFAKRLGAGGADAALYWKIVRRTFLLFALGLWLVIFPFYNGVRGTWVNPETLRIMGVLQRIALCYLAASLLYLWLRPKGLALAAAILLVLYWALMSWGGDLTPKGNLAAIIDRAVLGAHIWKGADAIYDPEGLLSTIPSIATTLIGVLAGQFLISARALTERIAGLFFWGFALLLLGWMWDPFFPINKPLWSSSYAVFMGGAGLMVLAACLWLIEVRNIRWWTRPFEIFGVNALALFVLSGMLAKAMIWMPWGVTDEGKVRTLKAAIYQNVFAPLASPENASLLFALANVAFWLFAMWLLWRRRVFIKI